MSDVLCLSSAALGYALLLRSVYLCYQSYHRELYIAFGGMSRAQLKHCFPH
ncbi:MAG TPA: hypothetical protein VJ724_03115 [Tahibacter sp.]|nr:hypothetical protein [Tahibacter sp.]